MAAKAGPKSCLRTHFLCGERPRALTCSLSSSKLAGLRSLSTLISLSSPQNSVCTSESLPKTTFDFDYSSWFSTMTEMPLISYVFSVNSCLPCLFLSSTWEWHLHGHPRKWELWRYFCLFRNQREISFIPLCHCLSKGTQANKNSMPAASVGTHAYPLPFRNRISTEPSHSGHILVSNMSPYPHLMNNSKHVELDYHGSHSTRRGGGDCFSLIKWAAGVGRVSASSLLRKKQ